MYQYFQTAVGDPNVSVPTEEAETDLVSIFNQMLDAELQEHPNPTLEEWRRTVAEVSLVAFAMGRAYEQDQVDEKFVTVHLPVDRAAKFIEMLLGEN